VAEVGFEVPDAAGFDDIRVRYDPPIPDGRGGSTSIDFMQVKHHVGHQGSVTAASLIDPAFIGAASESLLQKVHRLQRQYAPTGEGCRFILRQPWPVLPTDPLARLLSTQSGELRLDRLFDGSGTASAVGKIRKLWREHLGVDDAGLKEVLTPLRIKIEPTDLEQVKDRLNDALRVSGFKPVPKGHLKHPYDDLAWKLLTEQDSVSFVRQSLEDRMRQEQLYNGQPFVAQEVLTLGIRTFQAHTGYFDGLHHHHCAVEHFEGRQIIDPARWNTHLYPGVAQFLERHLLPGKVVHLSLEAHLSMAFAAGHASARSGAVIHLLERGTPWVVGNPPVRSAPDLWTFTPEQIGQGNQIAAAISVSQDALQDVRAAIEQQGLPVGTLIHARVLPEVGMRSVLDADHAYLLSQDLVQHLRQLVAAIPGGARLLLFAAIPKTLAFYLGLEAYSLGQIDLYEFNSADRQYHRSLRLP